jgi:LEA14-like dessication related protein
MMKSLYFKFCFYSVLVLLTACATLTPNIREPQVNLLAIKPLAAEGFEQRFMLTLKITNPNDKSLQIKGMSYALRVEGFNLVSGVASGLPEVAAYGSETMELEASTNLINGLRFLEQMITTKKVRDSLTYSLEAEIDLNNMLMPSVAVSHNGEVPLK